MTGWRAGLVRLPRNVLAGMLAVRLLDESNSFLLPGTFEPLRDELDLTYAQASSAFVLIALGAVAGTVATIAADYRSRRAIAAAGALGYALSLVVIGGAGGYGAVLAGCFIVGIASTAMVDATEVALADEAGNDLERHLTTQNILGSVGDLLGPAIVIGILGLGLSWRVCFFVSAGLVTVYGLWIATLPFPPPQPKDDDHSVRGAVRSVLRDPVVWLAGAAGLLLGPLDEPLLAFLIAHLQNARGIGEVGATVIAGLVVVGDFVGYATLRRRSGVLALDAALLAVSVTCMVLAPEAVTAGIASFVAGIFLVRFWINLQARVLTLRPGQAGTVKAVTSVIETVGWLLPLAAGAIADAIDVTAGLATYAFIAWGLAGVAVLLARASARRSGDPDPEAELPVVSTRIPPLG